MVVLLPLDSLLLRNRTIVRHRRRAIARHRPLAGAAVVRSVEERRHAVEVDNILHHPAAVDTGAK